ncbi:MAG TPA: hypothetical protein VFO55_10305 [Gemmatimonadaceae bacterium]|nr:hypothetical protein [Gemmatimonadaceae bacterium]
MKRTRRSSMVVMALAVVTHSATAQHAHGGSGAAERAMSGAMDSIAMRHMELTPVRRATKADSTKALGVVKELREAIAKYHDTTAAVRDGYRMFAPQLRTQKTYHFTKNSNAAKAAFRFRAAQPTSLLYEKDSTGRMRLVGAMYTMPKRASHDRLDDRIPLSIARWHKHVNWCVPGKKNEARWLETKNGKPVFGPESPIATKAECDRVGGRFEESVFGWMVHANVFAGDDLASIFGDHHAQPPRRH